MTDTRPTLAIIGGTGALGSGLARRWAKAGYAVVIGSRTPEKAAATAGELAAVASATWKPGEAARSSGKVGS